MVALDVQHNFVQFFLSFYLVLLILYCRQTIYNQNFFFLNVDGAMHFIYSHKYNTNSAEDSSDISICLIKKYGHLLIYIFIYSIYVAHYS